MSLPIVRAAVALAAGVAAGQALAIPLWAAILLSLLTLLLAIAAYLRSRAMQVSTEGTMVFGAVAAGGLFLITLSHNLAVANLGPWVRQSVILTGTVADEPEVKGREIRYTLRTEWIMPASAASHGTVDGSGGGRAVRVAGLVEVVGQARLSPDLSSDFSSGPGAAGRIPDYGDRVSVPGRLAWPEGPSKPGGFDPRANLARRGIALTFQSRGTWSYLGQGRVNPIAAFALKSRRSLERVIDRTLPRPEAPLLAGLIFGSRSQLPQEIKEDFRKTGVFHILSVSYTRNRESPSVT